MNDEMNENLMFAVFNVIINNLTEHVNDDEAVRPDAAATIAASLHFCLQTAAEMQLQAKETDERRHAVIQRLEADVRERDATIEALRQSLPAASGVWQPIETCREKMWVPIWVKDDNQPYIGLRDRDGKFVGPDGKIISSVTHWMPVAEPQE